MNILIRNEHPADYRKVEEITRKAFWNLHVPGCDEHLLAHKLRKHKDFVKELDFVAVKDSEVIANIMFSDSYLTNENGDALNTSTFGPVSVLPEYQRRGVGSKLTTGMLSNHHWQFHGSDVFDVNREELEDFDSTFEKLEKESRYTQEEFAILSKAHLEYNQIPCSISYRMFSAASSRLTIH